MSAAKGSPVRLSRAAQAAVPSGTLAIDEEYRARKARGEDVISLGAGQPDFPSPEAALAGGKEAIDTGRTRYTDVAGTEELRAAIARKLREENGLAFTPQQVVVTAGAKQAIELALRALVDPGDGVLVPVPAWPSYGQMVRLLGGTVIPVPIHSADGWKLRVDALLKAIAGAGRRADVLVLNQPSNPTGATYSVDDLARIAEAVRGEELTVISDEIYERLVYDASFTSFATLPGMRGRTITVNGFSKAFAMTGWRMGYAAGPAPVMAAIATLLGHTSGNASSVAQHAALRALESVLDGGEGAATLETMRVAFRARRDLVCRLLDAIPGVTYARPGGAFYVFVDVSAHYGRPLADGRVAHDSLSFAAYLLEDAGVAVVPGRAFGDDRCIRISFAASAEDLTVALKRIAKALA